MRYKKCLLAAGIFGWLIQVQGSAVIDYDIQKTQSVPVVEQDNSATEKINKTKQVVSLPATAPMPSTEVPIVLLNGTPIRLKLGRDLSSGTEKTNGLVDFEVVEEVKVGEGVVIPRGTLALGHIVLAQPRRRMGRTGKLEVAVDSVQLANAQKIQISATQKARDGSRVVAVSAATTAAGILFFPAAPFFLLIKGKDMFIPKGTLVTAYVSGDQKLDATQLPEKATENPKAKP